ncbi:class I SAM-dependent methyltransferase [Actinokineospora iranica]|uniref:Methyltransferase domain-containing protein n=1 Tax=Actinokineospora iranica TaxID=1271860 RepID=A0A1G6UEH1_9PSEU|nr:class I SAM-dependent methyltransferase [Actinokineospora iranica]SDD39782.1 Methyltransferase domain-containing protein [Actinokineospora iranica]
MTITEDRRAVPPGVGTSTKNPAAAEAVFHEATLRLLAPLRAMEGGVVADVGPGAGSATVALARLVGDRGRVYAVDLDPAMLDATMAAARRAGVADQVRPIQHDLEDGPPPLPEPVDGVWSSACVHHTRDWDAAVRGLAGLLRPGGVLCLAEGGLPTRCLPWDAGVGRPGLEVRLDEAHNRWFTEWFAARPGARRTRHWGEIMADAGLVDVTSHNALVDVPAPVPDDVRAVVLDELAARVGRATGFLDADDAAAWARLLDPADPAWLGRRTDLVLLTARTAHWGRSPARMTPQG